MEKFKGTPGPWFAEYSRENDAYEIAPMDRNGITMAWDREICITADNNVENANLIAAAPELLEALQYLTHALAYGSSMDVAKGEELAELAIKKALGEKQ